MREEDFAHELFVLVPNPNVAFIITSDEQVDEFVEVAACQRPVMFTLLFTVDVEEHIVIRVELEQVGFTRLEHHQKSVIVGFQLSAQENVDEIDFFCQFDLRYYLVAPFAVDYSPDFEVFFYADG